MSNWNNYCPRCASYVFSRRVKKGTPCPRCGQPCVEYGEMKRAQLAHMSRELQKRRDGLLRENQMSSTRDELRRHVELIVKQSVDGHNQLSVTSYMDLIDNIVRLVERHGKAIANALESLESNYVTANLFRLGAIGRQEVECAVEVLRSAAIRRDDTP